MSSPNPYARAGTYPSSKHLSPNASTSSFDQYQRGRSSSARSGLTSGRKGYNASPSQRSTSASPSPSRLSPPATSSITATANYRSALNEGSSRRSRSHSDGLTGRKGYNAESGLEGRKGYNEQSGASSRSQSRSRSREPRHQGLGSKSYYNSPLNPAREQSPVAAPFMERQRSGSIAREGITGRKGYNNTNERVEGASGSARSSPRPDERTGLGGRKGYNGSPQPSPLLPATGSGSSSPRHEGLGGRKGYNGSPQPGSNNSSPRPEGREGLGGRKGYNGSPQPEQGERRGSNADTEEDRGRKGSLAGLGIVGVPAPSRHGGLQGRKGYNTPNH